MNSCTFNMKESLTILKHQVQRAISKCQQEIEKIDAMGKAHADEVLEWSKKPFLARLFSRRPLMALETANACYWERPALKHRRRVFREILAALEQNPDEFNITEDSLNSVTSWASGK